MSSSSFGIERFPKARDSLASNRAAQKRHRGREYMNRHHEGTRPVREFFVPSFALRRAVMITPELLEFNAALNSRLKKGPYEVNPVDRLAMTELEQRRFRSMFIKADVQPEPTDVQVVAETIKQGLGDLLHAQPRKLIMPLGSTYAFGDDDRVIGIVPKGWKGFKARYPRKIEGAKGRITGLNLQIVNESNITLGAIANMFVDGIDSDGEVSPIDVSVLRAVTPHVTIAKKTSGPSITNDERATLDGIVSEVRDLTCPEFELFDPVIHLRLTSSKDDSFPSVMFARNPKIKDFESQLPPNLASLT